MTNDEVIIVKDIGIDIYGDIAYRAIKYALISVAFTYNRLDKK